jgi:hypothetical protein
MISVSKIWIILLLISYTIKVSSQEIKITEFRNDPRDISARENAIYDANGDACSLIKTRTGLTNLKFSSDLGLRKVEYHDGEYWLWVSPNTRQIDIEAEGVGKLQYKLPVSTEEYNVYIIFLTAILPDKVIFKDVNSFKIETHPLKADVFISKAFMGQSPLNLNISSDTIRYEIRKKRYIPVTGNFIYNELQKELFVSLKKDPLANRYFLLTFCGGSKLGTTLFGLQAGIIGKTGFYISFVPPVRGKKYIATVDYEFSNYFLIYNERFLSDFGEHSDDYYIKLKEQDNTFFNHFRLKAGVTQRIFNNTYLMVGIGFAKSTRFYRLAVIPYSENHLSDIPLEKTYYGKSFSGEISNSVLEIGLAYRIANSYLINLTVSTTGLFREISFLPLEITFGIGYNF